MMKNIPVCNCRHNVSPIIKINADRIRSMIVTDEGLAKALLGICDSGVYIPFCKDKPECKDLLEDGFIPESECLRCMIAWVKGPYKEETTNG